MIVNLKITFLLSLPPYLCNIEITPMYHLNNKQVMKKFQKIGIELAKGIAIVLAAYVLMATVNPAYTGLKHAIANIFFN